MDGYIDTTEAARRLREQRPEEMKGLTPELVKRWCGRGLVPDALHLGEGKGGRWWIPETALPLIKRPRFGRPQGDPAKRRAAKRRKA